MTVANTLRRAGPFTGDGVTTVFPFTFKVFAGTDVVVTELAVATNIETVKTLTTHYSVTLNPDQDTSPGGVVAAVAPPSASVRWTLSSAVPALQGASLSTGSGFYPEVIESALDKLTILVQEMVEVSGRTLRIPISSSSEATLPVPAASMLLGWSADASRMQNYALSTGGLSDAAAVNYTPGGVGAVATDVQAKLRETVSVADYGAVGDGVATDTTKLQAALDVGGDILVPAGTYNTGALTASVDGTRLLMAKGAVLNFTTLGAGVKAITVTANDFTIEGGKMQGPSVAAYVANENGIHMIGTSTSVRKSGLRVHGVEMTQFGAYAIYAQFVDRIDIERCNIHDCGFSGATLLSCDNGRFVGNTVKTMTPGTGANMYGLSLTHDSTGYSSDPNAGTKQAVHPFCSGWTVHGNEISDVDWEGLDCHGGYEVSIIGNRVYDTKYGISAPTSSGDAVNYAGFANIIAFNTVDGRNRDGTVSGRENTGYGINLNGGSTVNTQRSLCIGNIVRSKGIVSNAASGAIQAVYCKNVVVVSNIIDLWGGNGVYAGGSSILIAGNYFGGMIASGDTIGYCVSSDFGTGNHLTINGNTHDASVGNLANVGVWVAALTSPVLYASGNDFTQCAAPLAGTAYSWRGGQWGNAVSATTGDTTPSVKSLSGATHGTLLVPAGSVYTITNLDDGLDGQVVTIVNTGTQNVTIDRSNAYLDGSANQVLQPKYSLTLAKIGAYWHQVAKMIAAG